MLLFINNFKIIGMTQRELLENVLQELVAIKKGIPSGDHEAILQSLEDIEKDVSKLKYMLLNPEDGLVVKTNKNTEYRLLKERKADYYEKQFQEVTDMVKWKEGVTRALWILFAGLVGIIIKLIFQST